MEPDTKPTIAAIHLGIPDVCLPSPAVWFALFERAVRQRGITTDEGRYDHLVPRLSVPQLEAAIDILQDPPSVGKYDALKERILAAEGPSEKSRISQLCHTLKLGERKPSALLREMRNLAGARLSDEGLLRELWLQRLPSFAQGVLAAMTRTPLDELAAAADAIAERETVSATPSPSSVERRLAELERRASHTGTMAAIRPTDHASRSPRRRDTTDDKMDKLIRMFEQVMRSRSASRSRSRPRTRGGSPDLDIDGVCWYHRTFGDRANRCKPGCARAHQRTPEN